MMSKKDIEKYLTTLPDNISKEVTITYKNDIGQNILYHMSENDNIKEFIPFVSNRTMKKENRNIPRISTSTSILGDILGHQSSIDHFFNFETPEKYKEGYYIYSLEFEYALKPSKKLLPDAEISDEYWLVNYNKDTAIYKSKKIGKLFYSEITYIGVTGKFPKAHTILYLECKEPLHFFKNELLEKGYYKISKPAYYDIKNTLNNKNIIVEKISKSDYDNVKIKTAAMLEFKQSKENRNRNRIYDW